MKRQAFAGCAAFILTVAATGCGPSSEPELTVLASPRQILPNGSISEITVAALDASGNPGTGTVTLAANKGTLDATGAEVTLTLTNGAATAAYTCDVVLDPACSGTARITATWNEASSSANVILIGATSDAGKTMDAGGTVDAGGGTDAGTRVDAGTDAGTDAGMQAGYLVTLTTSKSTLVAETGDETTITATVTAGATGMAAADVPVTFTTSRGTFSATSQVLSVTVNTDASGIATVSLIATGGGAGTAVVVADTQDGNASVSVNVVGVASIVYSQDPNAATLLGIASSGRQTTTLIRFLVRDASQNPVNGVQVSFTVSGVAGATVSPPSFFTNAQGFVSTTLSSGDSVGTAIVRATVTATVGQTPELTGTHPGTPIVGGKPSDRGLQISCIQYNLGVNHAANPPRAGVTTDCTTKLVDRFSNPVGLKTQVQFFSEAGSVNSPVDAKEQMGTTPSADTGTAKTIFNATGAYPPYNTAAWTALGEPVDTGRNPRDMMVSIITVVGGEEDFYDGSGSFGVTNGKWDPGEWFVDLPEPFIDRNDNGVWDPGEFFVDIQQQDCNNPGMSLMPNGVWDGPNGCWDPDTQIWRQVHLVYSGALDPSHLYLSPGEPAGGYQVPVNGVEQVAFVWGDAHYNAMSPNSASITATRTGTRGNVSVTSNAATQQFGGLQLKYHLSEITTYPDGGTAVTGPCDTGLPTPSGTPDAGAVPTRCAHDQTFTFYGQTIGGGTSGTVTLTGSTQATGGPVSSIVTLGANHAFSSPAMYNFQAVFQ